VLNTRKNVLNALSKVSTNSFEYLTRIYFLDFILVLLKVQVYTCNYFF
jgi:hypothetical protein